MTTAYLNLSASPSLDQDDHLHHSSIFSSNNYQAAASSCSYIITRNFFDSASNHDQGEIYRQDIQQPQFQQDLADNLASSHGGSYDIENESTIDDGLKFSIWKKEEKYENQESSYCEIKWMSPKMRWMHKMKKDVDYATPSSTTNTLIKLEDHKHQPSSAYIETENTSNTSSNSTISNPIRTCSDCNTTKTPLWRSGPRGPKSLCNACGIRQRKARRAMAAAANDTAAFEKETPPPILIKTKKYDKMKTKTKQQKDKTSGRGVNVAKFKKRSCSNLMTIDGHESAQKKICLEDFLVTLTNNLASHQVFPQDEKDAAILLMAMSLHQAH